MASVRLYDNGCSCGYKLLRIDHRPLSSSITAEHSCREGLIRRIYYLDRCTYLLFRAPSLHRADAARRPVVLRVPRVLVGFRFVQESAHPRTTCPPPLPDPSSQRENDVHGAPYNRPHEYGHTCQPVAHPPHSCTTHRSPNGYLVLPSYSCRRLREPVVSEKFPHPTGTKLKRRRR